MLIKKITPVIIVTAALLLPCLARAESSPLYIGINAAQFDSKYTDAELDGGMINLGVDLNNYIALEIAGGLSKTEEDAATATTDKINYVASAFLRFNLRFDRVTVYVLGGYSQAEGKTTTATTTTVTTDNGGSYGYGIDFYGTRDLALSVRRVEFFDIDTETEKAHLGATMLGITYYFDTPKLHSRY